ncbi:uncharacterized protein [Clytia hemisphaerica]|uniref:uncharacterized protein n=1 Tax=Clytia hemisphaerica TaxID=252671 RepID=UPI0034D46E43
MNAVNSLLMCRNRMLNRCAVMNSIILKKGKADKQCFNRFNALQTCVSYKETLSKQTELGKGHRNTIKEWGRDIVKYRQATKEAAKAQMMDEEKELVLTKGDCPVNLFNVESSFLDKAAIMKPKFRLLEDTIEEEMEVFDTEESDRAIADLLDEEVPVLPVDVSTPDTSFDFDFQLQRVVTSTPPSKQSKSIMNVIQSSTQQPNFNYSPSSYDVVQSFTQEPNVNHSPSSDCIQSFTQEPNVNHSPSSSDVIQSSTQQPNVNYSPSSYDVIQSFTQEPNVNHSPSSDVIQSFTQQPNVNHISSPGVIQSSTQEPNVNHSPSSDVIQSFTHEPNVNNSPSSSDVIQSFTQQPNVNHSPSSDVIQSFTQQPSVNHISSSDVIQSSTQEPNVNHSPSSDVIQSFTQEPNVNNSPSSSDVIQSFTQQPNVNHSPSSDVIQSSTQQPNVNHSTSSDVIQSSTQEPNINHSPSSGNIPRPPKFVLVGDNLEYKVVRRHITTTKQNIDHHMFNIMGVKNRVNASVELEGIKQPPIESKLDIDLSNYFPNRDDECNLISEFSTLVFRDLTQYREDMSCMKNHLQSVIPHDHMEETKQKSEITSLGILNKNENKTEDIIEIMKDLHTMVPCLEDGELVKTFSVGDLLTVERETNGQENLRCSTTVAKRLEGLIPALADFHTYGNFMEVVWHFLYDASSSSDVETLEM